MRNREKVGLKSKRSHSPCSLIGIERNKIESCWINLFILFVIAWMTDENGRNKRQRIGGDNQEMERGWGTKCKQKTEGTGVDPSNTWKVDRFHKNRWYLKSTKSKSNNSFTFCFRSHCIYFLSLPLSLDWIHPQNKSSLHWWFIHSFRFDRTLCLSRCLSLIRHQVWFSLFLPLTL